MKAFRSLKRDRIGFCIMLQLLAAAALAVSAWADPIHDAAKSNNTARIEELLKQGANVNAPSPIGSTPLHFTALTDARDAAALLISKGANVNATNEEGATPLHWAGIKPAFVTAALLIEKGAKLDAQSTNGLTPLWGALSNTKTWNQLAAPENYLIDPDQQRTEMHNKFEFVELLIVKGADPKAPYGSRNYPKYPKDSHRGYWRCKATLLHVAAHMGMTDVAGFLIKHGAKINATNAYGETPLLRTADHWNEGWNMFEFLIKNGADVNKPNQEGETPLHLFLPKGEKYIECLIEHGANVNARDAKGRTPLDLAIAEGYGDAVAQIYKRHNLPVPATIKVTVEQLLNVITTGNSFGEDGDPSIPAQTNVGRF